MFIRFVFAIRIHPIRAPVTGVPLSLLNTNRAGAPGVEADPTLTGYYLEPLKWCQYKTGPTSSFIPELEQATVSMGLHRRVPHPSPRLLGRGWAPMDAAIAGCPTHPLFSDEWESGRGRGQPLILIHPLIRTPRMSGAPGGFDPRPTGLLRFAVELPQFTPRTGLDRIFSLLIVGSVRRQQCQRLPGVLPCEISVSIG